MGKPLPKESPSTPPVRSETEFPALGPAPTAPKRRPSSPARSASCPLVAEKVAHFAVPVSRRKSSWTLMMIARGSSESLLQFDWEAETEDPETATSTPRKEKTQSMEWKEVSKVINGVRKSVYRLETNELSCTPW